ncbi:MAG: serine/threonine-protein phosphatase [Phycisphaerae bacterium]|nr:serine/threonine-protein phosphatase [Phycisphaerae bacterium]
MEPVTTTATAAKFLWMGDLPIPSNVRQAVTALWELVSVPVLEEDTILPEGEKIALVHALTHGARGILPRLRMEKIVTVVLTGADGKACDDMGVLHFDLDLPAEELTERFRAAVLLADSLKTMQSGVTSAAFAMSHIVNAADDISEEMRLAARVQQDFLPRRLPKVGAVRFGVLYQPLGWVSGDVYDVSRLDETHVGFYVADAVGHGMPAALLTMFIKRALQTKRITGHNYEIIPPHEAMTQLNMDIYRQHLPKCEFCTGLYGVIDAQTSIVTLSRAGHPAPILIRPGQAPEAMQLPGPLLGIMPDAEYESVEVPMRPGDRLFLYSDGVEDILCGKGRDRTEELAEIIKPFASLEREAFIQRIYEKLSFHQQVFDDVTVLLMEVQKSELPPRRLLGET